jgi:drug/metabolite transporter (DMT)-like permease
MRSDCSRRRSPTVHADAAGVCDPPASGAPARAAAAAEAPAPPPRVRSGPVMVGTALGIVYVVWGSTYLAIRIMVEEMPPLVSAGVRFLTAGLLVAGFLVARGGLRRMAVTGRELAGCALIGILLPVLGQGMVTVGENGGAPSGITALLIAAVPLWVICYRFLSGERPTGRTLAGAFVGFCGVGVLITANGVGGSAPPWAIAVIVFAGLSWAFGSWYQPRLRLPGDPFVVVAYEMLVGGGVLTILGLAAGESFDPSAYSARSWLAWAYLVVLGSVVAFSAYVWLLQSAAVSLAATYAYVNPLVAVLLGWLILAETVTIPTIVGGAVVVVAVAVVVRSELQPSASPQNPAGSGQVGKRDR